jgi:hypothetical protein
LGDLGERLFAVDIALRILIEAAADPHDVAIVGCTLDRRTSDPGVPQFLRPCSIQGFSAAHAGFALCRACYKSYDKIDFYQRSCNNLFRDSPEANPTC